MKKILFIAAVSGSLLAGCDSGTSFTVNGTIEDVAEGKALLLTRTDNNTIDTLAIAAIANGKFALKGSVQEVTVATLSIEGTRNRISPLFVENAKFAVKFGKSPRHEGGKLVEQGTVTVVTGGGAAQQVNNSFFALQQEYGLKNNELSARFMATNDPAAKDSIREVARALDKELKGKTGELVKANPDAYASAYYLYVENQTASAEVLKEKLGLLGEKARETKFGKMFAERIALLESVAIGQIAPDFTMPTPDGGTLSLHGVKAKVKLIDFWASWCGPCRAENPNVVKVYAEYHPKGLEIIGVSLDDNREKWLEAIEKDQLTWLHGSDLQGWQAAPAKLYVVNAIPHTVLLDENNRIIAKNLRGDALKEKLAELLGAPAGVPKR
jgi:thiol-disulfide isomerase/thioredoxin